MESKINFINNNSPIIFGLYLFLSKQKINLLWYIVSFVLNIILKQYIFKPIMDDFTYPIIGNGNRPCSNLKSFGMPSGHAQACAFITINQMLNGNKYWPLIFIISIEVIYSRVKDGHHTIQQVIVGYLFGVLLALFVHNNVMKI